MENWQEDQYYLDEVVQPQYNKDLLVLQANELVRSQQDNLTLLEARLVRLAIAQILKNDDDFRTYEIDIISLAKLLKMDKFNIYHEMDKLTTDLMRKIIYIRDNKESKKQNNYIKLHWVDTVKYRDGIITFKLSEELRPYLLGLHQLFTMYEYEDIIELPTTYSIRLFELLTSYQNMRYRGIHNKEYNGVAIDEGEVVFTISYLRKFFNCEDYYKDSNGKFIDKVIKSSVNNINKKTLSRISYRTEKNELNRKEIKYVIFKFHSLGEEQNMKKLLTVKEYADLQNTSVQNIYKKIKRDKIAVIEKKDDTGRVIKYIEFDDNTEDETNIEDTLNEDNFNSSIDSSEDNKEKQSNKNTTELELLKKTIEIIEGQLKEKDKQIESLNSQIEKLSTMLDQSQKLQALSLTKKAEITEGVVDEEVEEKEPIENNNSEKSLQNEEKSIWQRIKDWFTL